MNSPSLAMIPCGYKAGKLYSVLPTDGTGDFTVSRASKKQKINSDLKLEIINNNVPAFNYDAIGGCPVLNTEPQATNLITYPISFGNNYWTKSGASIQADPSTAGSELITLQNDREFITTVGNWLGYNGATIDWISTGRVDVTMNTGAPAYSGITLPNAALSSSPVVGNIYKLEIELEQGNATVNNIRIEFGGAYQDVTIGASQVFTVYLKAIATTQLYVYANPDEDAKFWLIRSASIKQVQGFSSPHVDYPTSAFKLVEDTGTSSHYLNIGVTTGGVGEHSMSYFVKPNGIRYVVLASNANGGVNKQVGFDLTLGTITYDGSGYGTNKIESLANGWFRISASHYNTGGGALRNFTFNLSDSEVTSNTTPTYTGDGTSGVYIFMAQVEQSSVATSPTFTDTTLASEGSTTTRLADVITGGGSLSTFTDVSLNGGFIVDIKKLFDTSLVDRIGMVSATFANNSVWLQIQNGVIVYLEAYASGVYFDQVLTATTISSGKVGVRWDNTNMYVYHNGVLLKTKAGGSPLSLNEFTFAVEFDSRQVLGDFNSITVLANPTNAEMISKTT